MAGGNRPRRGSMGFYPRKRAKSIVARVRSWPKLDDVKPLGFAGYKVGMLHVIMIEDNPNSPYYGKEVAKAATVIEVPPLVVCGVRAYKETPYGLKCIGEIWAKEVYTVPSEVEEQIKKIIGEKSKKEKKSANVKKRIKELFNKLGHKIVFFDLKRVFTLPKIEVEEGASFDEIYQSKLEEFKKKAQEASEIRLIVATQPRKAGIHRKKPEVFEIPVGGAVSDALEYALGKLGQEIDVTEVFEEGHYVDVISITKGKGFASVIKRFGVKILPRWHKHRKGSRRIGSIGPTLGVMFTVPRPGQLGFQQRTEYNKRILKIGDDPSLVNPKGGFKHYGIVRTKYLIIEGSVPGPCKRLIKLRHPIRLPPRNLPMNPPKIEYISTTGILGEKA